ncbi:MAG: hypothetical protein U9N73_05400, partial [Candidatus Auribacterota bacterium]|nr:hypothetical protein [Candidatus Auribacterota bacterium]
MSEIIGISFMEDPPAGIPRLDTRDEHCRFIGRARKGAFYISSENVSCPLARFYLGIGRTDREKLARILVS